MNHVSLKRGLFMSCAQINTDSVRWSPLNIKWRMASAMRPKTQLDSQLSAAPVSTQESPQGPFKLFVRFPLHSDDLNDTRFHCIFTESDSVSVTALKARIELLLGLPGKRLPPYYYYRCHIALAWGLTSSILRIRQLYAYTGWAKKIITAITVPTLNQFS